MAKNDDPATTLDRRTLQPEEIERLLTTELTEQNPTFS